MTTTYYHSGNCPGHRLAPGELPPALAQCRQYHDTVAEHVRRAAARPATDYCEDCRGQHAAGQLAPCDFFR